jgi:hypothetical protein
MEEGESLKCKTVWPWADLY